MTTAEFEALLRKAWQGDAESQAGVASSYRDGNGTAKDDSLALYWARKAAEQGDAFGQFGVGIMYEQGRAGLAKDTQQARAWFQRVLAQQDKMMRLHPTSYLTVVGLMYHYGYGVPKDEIQAMRYYRPAAEQGNPWSQFSVGLMYEHGLGGLPKDIATAVFWYSKSAEQGYSWGEISLGRMYEHGLGGIPKNHTQAVAWYRKAAERGNEWSQYDLGRMYEAGLGGLPKDDAQAVFWYRKAAQLKRSAAQNDMGRMYEQGRGGLHQDIIQAALWYRKAAKQGLEPAQNNLNRLMSKLPSKSRAEVERLALAEEKDELARAQAPVVPLPPPPDPAAPKTGSTAQQNSSTPIPLSQVTLSLEIARNTLQYDKANPKSLLGKGSFGAVYTGTWQGHTSVAVKELYIQHASEESIREFKNEMDIMAQLRHPQIVHLYGVCTLEGPYCMVMEWMHKGSLYRVLHTKDQDLSWPQRQRIALDIGSGLAFLHAQQPHPILHRDLKSLNILLDEHFRAKLADFGLAKLRKESASNSTQAGGAGTVFWMAPELFGRGEKAKATTASDVYSLGMILWEIASRKLPFDDVDNPGMVAALVQGGEREPIPADTPELLRKLITECWDGDVAKRPSAAAVLQSLQGLSTAIPAAPAAIAAGPRYDSNLNSAQLTGQGYQSNWANQSAGPRYDSNLNSAQPPGPASYQSSFKK